MAISTNGTVLARLAGGLYNTTLSNATYAEVNAVVKTAADINTLANDLYARDFASKTDLSVATTLLSNLGLSSVTGLANWVAAQLTAAGAANKGAKVVSLLNDFANLSSDATYGAAATSFNTKTTAALALSQKDGSAGGDFNVAAAIAAADAAAAAAAAAAKAAADAAAVKAAADAAADAAAVKAAADAAAAAAVKAAADAAAQAAADAAAAAEKAPQTFTLTTGANTLTGKSGNDTFDGALNSTGAQTLTSIDSLDGGAGTDSLFATIAGTSSYSPTLSNIEQLVTTFTAAGTLNLANTTGVTSIQVTGSSAAANITNIASPSGLALNVNSSGQNVTFDFKDSSVVGTADSVTLTLADVTAGTIAAAGIETVNIVSNGDTNAITALSDAAAKVINVSGAGNLSLGTIPSAAKTVNASTMTGGLTVTAGSSTTTGYAITGGSGNDALTGGVGNDVLTGNAGDDVITSGAGNDNISAGDGDDSVVVDANLDVYDTVSGGAGTDDLSFTSGGITLRQTAAAVHAGVTGFETVTVSDPLTSALSTAYIQAGITGVTLTGGAGAAVTVTMEAGSKTLALGTTANAGTLTVSDTGSATTDSLTITSGTATNSLGGVALAVNGYESVSYKTGSVATTVSTISVTGDAASTGLPTPATLTLSGAGSLTTTGAITLSTTATAAGVINASAMTGDFVMGAAASGVTSITGGTGNDTLRASDTNSTLVGGDGNDVITGGAGNDSLSGGAGNDTITGGAANDTIDAGDGDDSVVGGAGNDNISLGAGTNTLNIPGGNFTATTTVAGGSGTDTIRLSNITAIDDSMFVNKTSLETLTNDATNLNGIAATIGTNAAATGITTVTFAGTASGGIADSLTVSSGFTNTLKVNLGTSVAADTTTVAAGDYTGTLTVTAGSNTPFITTGTPAVVTGGTGTADTLNLVTGTYSATHLGSVTAIEKIVLTSSTTAPSVTLAAANAVVGQSLTVNGSAYVGSVGVAVNGDAITAGQLIVIGSVAADTITGSSSLTAGDSITAGLGADSITFGLGDWTLADTVAGGDGTDSVIIGATGDTIVDANFTNLTSIETLSYGVNSETITLGALAAAAGIVTLTDGSGNGSVTVGSGFTNALTFAMSTGTENFSAAAYTGALTVTAADTSITSADTLTAGTGSTDTMNVTFSGGGLSSSNLGNVTKFETLKSATNAATGAIVLPDTFFATGVSASLNFAANTTTVVTLNAAAESNASITLITGGGADVLVASSSSYGDSISSGSGDDSITIAAANFTSTDTINGGDGNDTLTVGATATLTDAAFTNVSNIETFAFTSGANSLVAGSAFQTAGASTITGGTAADSITIGSGVTRNLQVNLGTSDGDNESVVATGYTGALTVTATADTTYAAVDASDTLTGGSGSDTLTVTFVGTWSSSSPVTGTILSSADLANVTKFETIKTGSNVKAQLTLNDANTANSSITVNAAANTSAAFILDASNEDDSTLVYVGGAGGDTVTGTTGADTITGGTGADSILGGAGADVISGGSGADTIIGGAGADVMTGGAGADVYWYLSNGYETGALSPAVIYYGGTVGAGTSVSTTGFDVITDFASGDSIITNGTTASTTSGVNAVGEIWTAQAGFLRGTYSSTAGTFVFSTTGTDSIYAYDFDGSSTTNDVRAIVLVGYVDSGTSDTMTTGLVGVA